MLILNSCKKDETPVNPLLACIGTATTPIFESDFCSNSFSDSLFCEIRNIGDFLLDDSSKEFMIDYCKLPDDLINFQNDQGETIHFILDSKSYRKKSALYTSREYCNLDSIAPTGLCFSGEFLEMVLRSDGAVIELRLMVELLPEFSDNNQGQVGEYFSISRRLGVNSFTKNFSALINQKTLSSSENFNIEKLERFTINETNYLDVYSNNIENTINPDFKYYVNREYGLFAFQDTDGVLWEKQ